MFASRFSRRVLILIGLGVTLPALVLAAVGALMTLRVSRALDAQTDRYNLYMARQTVEGLERELLSDLRDRIGPAENVARLGGNPLAIREAMGPSDSASITAEYVSLDQIADYFLLLVESTPLIYRSGAEDARGRRFAGLMLRNAEGQVSAAGGWWVAPDRFLASHLQSVVEERIVNDERMYGGIESRRQVSIRVIAPNGATVAEVRPPGPNPHATDVEMEGPFEGFRVRAAASVNAPIAGTKRLIALNLAFILVMAFVLLIATYFALRYTVRQIELARIKSSFLSNVSHELKTPIALIRLAVETLEMGRINTPEERDKFLRRIGREAVRLNNLVENILDFARLEAGQRAFRFTNVDVIEAVRETVDSFRLRIEDQGFQLTLELPETLPPVRGDGLAIAQCLLNLLDNAVKYSRERKEIRIASAAHEGFVTVSVSDRGIGIAPRDQKKIFEKFVRLEDGLVHDVKGAGLGLSLVYQIMKAHGGRVEVRSVLNGGSTFTLWLPRAAESAPQPEAQARTGS
ncbi:MAG: HAMP domain-containing histidine kinase [Candidatus Eisenbacteria bacterium]|uniref:histidine kinase n=1 Tax=Eiseniibacteriota bacterium TaxID=2212470 RepID=A0A849SVU6_UNCEI|nr:HAMP domain-containing histidine kinase [Candidatus Eisenbacteria bacterium]